MLVNKPQFDTENIKIGKAYWMVKHPKGSRWTEITAPCIVTKVTELNLYVVYVEEQSGKVREINITINEVVDGVFTLSPMKMKEVN